MKRALLIFGLLVAWATLASARSFDELAPIEALPNSYDVGDPTQVYWLNGLEVPQSVWMRATPAASGGPAGQWSVLQQRLLSCPALTSPCAITVASTTAGSAMAVYIITDNSVTITSVSGGGGTWNLCAASACHVVNTGNDSLDAAYNLTGTGGATSISVSLSTSGATELFAGFMEFAPPKGTTPQLDTVGVAQSSSCLSNCPTPALTLTGTNDAVFLGDDTDHTLVSCTSPYQDCVGPELMNAENVSSVAGATFAQNVGASYASSVAIAFMPSAVGSLPSTSPFVSGSRNSVAASVTPSVTCSLPVTSGNLVVLDVGQTSNGAPTFSVVDGNTRYTWSSHITSPISNGSAANAEGWGLVASATETLNVTITTNVTFAGDWLLCSLRQYTVANGTFDQTCSTCSTASPGASSFTATTSGNLTANNEIVTGCLFQPFVGGNYGFVLSNANAGFAFRPPDSMTMGMLCQDKVLSGGSGSTASMTWNYAGTQTTAAGVAATLATFQP